ncbi:DUF1876 domain-containing protein [Mycolicibacterium cosmeticum]|jgi:hypothetical protein|uniref:DUF1876 domain-containing protein n=1 Tax=Mycolicibacterium cosmeticum TaxID=258533 RepID=W9B8Q5_MYCCO|nr:dsRBD fold-containing protein [Mycolicibacterium cosmeticum]TLH74096.1 DUF1876 domain-containing protein [Mycolicibacterium cosmeticum]CDO11036.1 hypothetical protein BN977_05877 [Mycolicibacterium cosmeticum]
MSHKHSKKHLDQLTVKIDVDRIGEGTRAIARMDWENGELIGRGRTTLDPDDHFPDEVGENLAIARALSDIAGKLYAATASEIQLVTGERVSVR